MLETSHPPYSGHRAFRELTRPCKAAIAKATSLTPDGNEDSHAPVWGKRRGNRQTLIT